MLVSLFFISCKPEICNFIKKETLGQVFSCEFCEISKDTFCYRTRPVAASEKTIFPRLFFLNFSSKGC